MKNIGRIPVIHQSMSCGVEAETAAYMSLPNPTLDVAALNDNIRLIKYGAGITLASLTANLSTVNGTAFVSNPSVDLRPYVGFKHSLAAGGKTLVGWAKAVGTGETLGSELITGFPLTTFNTLTVSAPNITSAINISGAMEYCYSNGLNTSNGTLLKFTMTLTKNSGVWVILSGNNADTSLFTADGTAQEINYTQTTQTRAIQFYNGTDPFNTNFSAVNSLKQVLTPSATGITIVSAQGGSTYNWTSDDGIGPNAASFVDTITSQ